MCNIITRKNKEDILIDHPILGVDLTLHRIEDLWIFWRIDIVGFGFIPW